MKNLSILPSGLSAARDCLNMRPSLLNSHALVPVKQPMAMHNFPWRCVGTHLHTDGTITELLTHDTLLAAVTHEPGTDMTEPYIVVDNLTDRVTAALTSKYGFTVLTEGTPIRLEWDDDRLLRAVKHFGVNDYPAITSATVDEVSLPCHSGVIKLSRTYSALPEYPDPADSLKIKNHLAAVCEDKADRATLSGVFTAPVLFRYRLLAADGRVLFTSPPTMHRPSGRHAASSPLRLTISGTEVLSTDFSIEGYGIGVSIPGESSAALRKRVARLELQLSQQLHISLFDTMIVGQVRKYGNDNAVEIDSPGYGGQRLLVDRVSSILSDPDHNFHTVLTLFDPLSLAGQTVSISPVIVPVADEKTTITVNKNDSGLSSLLSYHDWGAAVGINDGARQLLANLNVTRYRGVSVSYFINTGITLDNIETAVTVTFDNGKKITCTRYLRGPRDVSLSPVLCYPDPSAVKMEIQLCDSDGVNRYAAFPLTPVSSSMSAYIDPDLQPIDLIHSDNAPEFYLPPSTGLTFQLPGTLLSVENTQILSSADIGSGDIVAITPASRASTSAWEASRSRFHLMAGNGIYALSLNAGLMQSPRLLDRRPVVHSGAVASLTTADGTLLFAIAGGDLVRVDNDRTATVAHDVKSTLLCPLPRWCELLLIPPASMALDGNVTATVLHLGTVKGWSSRTLPAVEQVYSDRLVNYLTSPQSIIDVGSSIDTAVDCHYRREIKQPVAHPLSGVKRLPYIVIDLESPAASGDITISGSHGTSQHEEILSRLSVDGPVYRPLCHHLLAPARYKLWLYIDLSLTPQSILHLND